MGSPLFRVGSLRAIEDAAQAGLPAGELMGRAGRAAAAYLAQGAAAGHWCIVCGPGNNGGDGYVVAAELRARGHEVTCVRPSGAPPAAADARAAFERWASGGGRVVDELPHAERFTGVVDAMFGIGLSRPLGGAWLAAADWLSHRAPVALDVPSGLDADTGAWVDGVPGVRAVATITFIGDKPGLHTGDGADASGRVQLEPLDLDGGTGDAELTSADDLAVLLRPRRRNSHKGSYGSVGVIGGGPGMVGAALLAARAALRIGAGRVYAALIGAPDFRVDPLQPELMFRPVQQIRHMEALVVGCGMGTDEAARDALALALSQETPLVIDADALNLLAADAALRSTLAHRAAPAILTPHPLEAARLLDCSAADVQRDRAAAAVELARRCRAVALLKGAGTVIADPDGRIAINPTGSPALATAGSGDVLAGMLGALIAQGLAVRDAAVCGAWLHGAAAGTEDRGLVAGEIAMRAMAVLHDLQRGTTGADAQWR